MSASASSIIASTAPGANAIITSAARSESTPISLQSSFLLLNDVDVDGDALTVTAVSNAVNGTVTVTFADYDIDDPSGGPASVGSDGELEVLLVFTR